MLTQLVSWIMVLATSLVTSVSPHLAVDHKQSVSPSIPSLSVVTQLAPGVEYINVDRNITCTFGFKAKKNNQVGYITAGHCGVPGETVAVKTPSGLQNVGTFTWSLGTPDGTTTAKADLAFIATPNPGTATVRLIDKAPAWTMEMSYLRAAAPDLCKVGPESGGTCGAVTKSDIIADTISFPAASLHGDSGSPIFARKKDGSLVAIAILSGSPKGEPDRVLGQLIDDATLAQNGLTIQGS